MVGAWEEEREMVAVVLSVEVSVSVDAVADGLMEEGAAHWFSVTVIVTVGRE